MGYGSNDLESLIELAIKAVELAEEKGFLSGKLAEKDATILTLQATIKEQGEIIERLATASSGDKCPPSDF